MSHRCRQPIPLPSPPRHHSSGKYPPFFAFTINIRFATSKPVHCSHCNGYQPLHKVKFSWKWSIWSYMHIKLEYYLSVMLVFRHEENDGMDLRPAPTHTAESKRPPPPTTHTSEGERQPPPPTHTSEGERSPPSHTTEGEWRPPLSSKLTSTLHRYLNWFSYAKIKLS